MTIFVHRSVSEVAQGDHRHRQEAKAGKKGRRPDLDTDRVWAFDCEKACEQSVLRRVALTANHPGGVILTPDEERLRVDEEAKARTEMSRLSEALVGVARERVASGDLAGKG